MGFSARAVAVRPWLLCAALAVAACRDEAGKPVRSEAPPAVAPRPALVPMGEVVSAAALALVPAEGGALLVWAPPAERGGGIAVRALDALGAPRAAARVLVPAEAPFAVTELAAAATRDRLGVVWSESSPQQARIRALLVPLDGHAPAEPQLLAGAPAVGGSGRGRLAIAAMGDDRMRLLYPAGATECADSEHDGCVGYAFHELGGVSARREPWLSVPQPCPEGAATLAGLDGRFFYAVCSWRGDAPSTMAYAINVDTYYARADEVLRGCAPLGMLAIDEGTVLLGADCGVLRRAARLTLELKPAAEFPLADLGLSCTGSRPVIRASGFELELTSARAGLEAVLPDELAPPGARAVWTGKALIVVQRMSGGIELHRHVCEQGALRSETSAAARGRADPGH
jgi:hypothetical protein